MAYRNSAFPVMLRRPASLARPRPIPSRRAGVALAARHASSSQPSASRIHRITAKLPKRWQKYANGLRSAPLSHVVSFLVLHEITAIVPLLALFSLFHYTSFVPVSYVADHFADYTEAGIARFERYFRRKGWFGFDQHEPPSGGPDASHTERVMQRRESGDRSYEILVEVALAYAVTKALLPLRIVASLWATPWFAGVITRLKGLLFAKS